MKLPNGYGSVKKLSGDRHKPFGAFAPARRTPKGYKQDLIGCFKSRAEALSALSDYHKKIFNDKQDITLREVFEEYKETNAYKKIGKSTQEGYAAAWKWFSEFENVPIKNIRTSQIQSIIDSATDAGKSFSSIHKVKVLAGLLEKYAMSNDIINKNYAEFTSLPENNTKEKERFSDLQLKQIETAAQQGIGIADIILIMCYTGWRISEFVSLTPFEYDAENKTLTGGAKTEAGKNRIVPVAPKIQPYVDKWIAKNGETIFCNKNGQKMSVRALRMAFGKTLNELGIKPETALKFTPHATRHTFVSMLNKNNIDAKTSMMLAGHSDVKIHKKTYSHSDLEQLKKAVNSL